MNTISEKQVLDFVRSKKEMQNNSYTAETIYYMDVFKKNKNKKWFLSWNWGAFLASLFCYHISWLIYRRMYLYTTLSIILILVLYVLDLLLGQKTQLFSIILMGLYVFSPLFFAIFGNALYFYNMRRMLSKQSMHGGTNNLIVWLWLSFHTVITGSFIIAVFYDLWVFMIKLSGSQLN